MKNLKTPRKSKQMPPLLGRGSTVIWEKIRKIITPSSIFGNTISKHNSNISSSGKTSVLLKELLDLIGTGFRITNFKLWWWQSEKQRGFKGAFKAYKVLSKTSWYFSFCIMLDTKYFMLTMNYHKLTRVAEQMRRHLHSGFSVVNEYYAICPPLSWVNQR